LKAREAGQARRAAPVAVITGASSGFGAATAGLLASEGFRVFLGARREERVASLAEGIGGRAQHLDVTDLNSIRSFVRWVGEECGRIDVLVNNAGLALGRETVDSLKDDDLIRMWETNVLGLLRMTREALPLIRAAEHGHIVNIGSVAGFDNYKGGAGYASTKHAIRSITQTLRLELNGTPIRVTEIAPGMSETEFSLVRFKGDREEAADVYRGLAPLQADDVAECIAFAVSRPPHVNVDYLVVRPVAQATSWMVARETPQ
jgi:NADP-dependent 3-hydroxy acid dehydrogenase YdfG